MSDCYRCPCGARFEIALGKYGCPNCGGDRGPAQLERGPARPAIDHSILSPSGRASQRARRAALQRAAEQLFPAGFWDPTQPSAGAQLQARREALLRQAAELRALAARGMKPRAHRKQAAQLEAEAAALLPSHPPEGAKP